MDIAKIVSHRYRQVRSLMNDVFERVETNKTLYASKLEVDDLYEWDYNLVDPHIFPLIRNYLSRSNPNAAKIRLTATKPEALEYRKINQALINWELNQLMMTDLFYRVYFSGYIAGKGYLKTGWYHKDRRIVKEEKDGKVIRIIEYNDVIDRADAKFVKFNNILIPNQNEPSLYEQPYILEIQRRTIGELLDEGDYWDRKWLFNLRKDKFVTRQLPNEIEIPQDADLENDIAFRSAYVELLCMHTKDGELYYVPLWDQNKVVNKNTENPYWHGHYPFIDFTPFPEDDNFFSLSIVDVVGDLQIAATEVLNQTMTNIRQINNDMWIAGSDASQTPDWQFQKRPSGIIRVAGDVSQVQQIRTQDNTMSALRFRQDLQNSIERSAGISSLYSSGVPSQTINQTARGAMIIEQNVSTNIRMIVDLFGEQVIKRLGEHFLELNAQYITEDIIFNVTGEKNAEKFVTITPSQVNLNYNVSVNADRMVKQTPTSIQASLQNLTMNLLSIRNQAPDIHIDLIPVVQALINSYPVMDNVSDVIMSVDEKAKRDIERLERGQIVEVKARDQHQQLLQIVKMHYQDNEDKYSDEVKAVFGKYFIDHQRFMEIEQQNQLMTQPQLPQPKLKGLRNLVDENTPL